MNLETIIPEMAASVNWKLEGNHLLSKDLQKKALSVLENTAFPTTRTEAWKYTRLAKIRNGNFVAQQTQLTSNRHQIDSNAVSMVFVNGHFAANLSSTEFPEGIKLLALSQMEPAELAVLGTDLPLDGELFNAFNTAYATDGVYLHISANMHIEPVIEITHITTGNSSIAHVRNILIAEAFSKAQVIQQYVTENAATCFTNVVTEVSVAKNAFLTIDKLQYEDESCFTVATEQVTQAADSNFTINTITLNGGLVRNNLNIAVNGNNCETHLNGAYILKGNQHVDNHTVVDHKVAHCVSNELYKGVIDEKATAVFNGKVFVRKDAQKINAFQSNGNVLLSDDATVNSKPELEIYADDVKCSHGSTTGQLDEEAVFYLRARGIGEKAARQLMVGAFVGDVFAKLTNEPVKLRVDQLLQERFEWNFD
ncbi:MAG: Fe-S cluster assembly protein SufD [Bacteroidota bacterium]